MDNNPNSFNVMTNTFDTNINNYSLSDVMIILGLDNQPTREEVIQKSDNYINKYKNSNPLISNFFMDAKKYVLDYLSPNKTTLDNTYTPIESQVLDWWNRESLKQDNPIQNDKITDREQKIRVFGNNHVPMNREQLGINNNFSVGVAQDTLNPNLTNITTRFINLDSQFRQYASGYETSNTDYTLDLSEPLTNVLSLRLYSIQIPHSWYTYDSNYGNTCFWILFDSTDINVFFKISLPSGNYPALDIVNELNLSESNFSSPNFVWPTPPSENYPVSYNPNNGKITINIYGGEYTNPETNMTYKINEKTIILFYDINSHFYSNKYCFQQNKINQTFGWYLGFRLPQIYVQKEGNDAIAVINTYGPKYLLLIIDDFNQNHINNGLVTITEISTNIKLPSYYDPTTSVTCINPNLEQYQNSPNTAFLMDKGNISYKKIPQVVPTYPRILTQAQIYSINEIQKNNESNTSLKSKAPTNSNIFALLPIKMNRSEFSSTGHLYTEFTGSLQENKRIYFGPVNLVRMRVTLIDDMGNIVNLNGADWNVTLISEILYQY
jgi:hypothetical protein